MSVESERLGGLRTKVQLLMERLLGSCSDRNKMESEVFRMRDAIEESAAKIECKKEELERRFSGDW